MQRQLPYALSLALFAACSSPKTESSVQLEPEVPAVQMPTDLEMMPPVWETAGDTAQPVFQLESGPASRPLVVTFEYMGDGNVEIPAGGRVEVGEQTVTYAGRFQAQACSTESVGNVMVRVCDEETGILVSEAEWPVVLRTDIVNGIEVTRARSMSEGDYFACYVAVRYAPMPEGLAAPADRDERVTLSAVIKKQGGFDPEVHVVGDLDPELHQRMPMGFEENDDQRIFFVSVREPAFPPVRRAYVELEAKIGGDSQKVYVPLPNR